MVFKEITQASDTSFTYFIIASLFLFYKKTFINITQTILKPHHWFFLSALPFSSKNGRKIQFLLCQYISRDSYNLPETISSLRVGYPISITSTANRTSTLYTIMLVEPNSISYNFFKKKTHDFLVTNGMSSKKLKCKC